MIRMDYAMPKAVSNGPNFQGIVRVVSYTLDLIQEMIDFVVLTIV